MKLCKRKNRENRLKSKDVLITLFFVLFMRNGLGQLTCTGGNWAQEAYIKALNNDANDRFGFSVSLDGDTLAVGASSEDSNQTTITNGATASPDNSNADSGSVYVYKRAGVN